MHPFGHVYIVTNISKLISQSTLPAYNPKSLRSQKQSKTYKNRRIKNVKTKKQTKQQKGSQTRTQCVKQCEHVQKPLN